MMMPIQQNNSIDDYASFRDFKGYLKKKKKTRTTMNENTYILHYITSILERENNIVALEVLHLLQYFLNHYLKDSVETISSSIIYLLTEDERKFLCTNDLLIKELFGDCPFLELQKLVKLASYVREQFPTNFHKEVLYQCLANENKINKYDLEQKKSKNYFPSPFINDSDQSKLLNNNLDSSDSMDLNSWLKNRYDNYKRLMSELCYDEFRNMVLQILKSDKGDDELQNDLFEILGFDLFELAAEILSQRKNILKSLTKTQNVGYISATKLSNSVATAENFNNASGSSTIQQNNLNGDELAKCITSSKTPRRRKRRHRKRRRKPSTNYENIAESDDNKNIHDLHEENRKKVMVCGKMAHIPFDAEFKTHDGYDEIYIPPREVDVDKGNKRILIKDLDDIGKMVFKDVEEFNYIQSEVFPIAYNTNENMLVCAPTGAGKTNIALLTIVHQIKNFIDSNSLLNIANFKIVYICPMKALAAEITYKFGKVLHSLGITVREVTGDMQLTKREISETQILVATPEKWDVITRKGTVDVELINLVKLLIFDEVHLLNTDRGPVIEALVARTLRQVISTQNMIRIVGLSATLPGYRDVAQFLRVNPKVGLFFFDGRYRTVPLAHTFIGKKGRGDGGGSSSQYDEPCFDKVTEFLAKNHQVLVFVHARNDTFRTANTLKRMAIASNKVSLFMPPKSIKSKKLNWDGDNLGSDFCRELFEYGIGIHHAGISRPVRSLTEKSFMEGSIRVLVCTATLAWGVNLPAHAVIIKGTAIYDSKKGGYKDLDVLDLLQIFGRAGRPQFDSSGHGIIITQPDNVHHYLSAITNPIPVESNLMNAIPENLNAEIVLGTISNVQEAVEWLTFTYMYRRMLVNPLPYGLDTDARQTDPILSNYLLELTHNAAKTLHDARMIRYNETSGELTATHLGRTASYYYINVRTIEIFNRDIFRHMHEDNIIYIMCKATEFSNMLLRHNECPDLEELLDNYCSFNVPSGIHNENGKACILMQAYLSRAPITKVSLGADVEYIKQNAIRIARALFEMAVHQNFANLAKVCLTVAQCFEKQLWPDNSVFWQFKDLPIILIDKLEKSYNMEAMRDMNTKDIGAFIKDKRQARLLKTYLNSFPDLEIESSLQPITRSVLRVKLVITPKFKWSDHINGDAPENFWVWVINPDADTIYHSESFILTKSMCVENEPVNLILTVPLVDPKPSQYLVTIISDKWMHAVFTHSLSFRNLIIPEALSPPTELLELQPLSVKALKNPAYEKLYSFSHYNPIQTQMFYCLYYTDNNVLLGAPTGSGKTIAAETCIFRLFNNPKKLKTVYIAPLKALVRERMNDWKERFHKVLNKKVVEVTGDVSSSTRTLEEADLIVSTPEKWDGLSRRWKDRKYIQSVGLIIIDEIHLLGEDRGPVLEIIVSRTNFIANKTGLKPRIIGLSTAVANAGDLAKWLGIKKIGLYNFRPSVRPVPLETHIVGFPGQHYCPRMLSMNRPAFNAIKQFAPDSPVLIFCSSRKQTRLTAVDLVTCLLTERENRNWLRCDFEYIEDITYRIRDKEVKNYLTFGIGIHHAGILETDREIVEQLFKEQKIQILISTATLAWGVNFPAHLVIIKGTEYYDGVTNQYVEMPITDILQMMGRAGRPQYDTSGVACVYVKEAKKNFYKKFLYEPFPIESSLINVLPDHINAEISAETINTKEDLLEFLKWTFYYQRLLSNPDYYNLRDLNTESIETLLLSTVDTITTRLIDSNCITMQEKDYATRFKSTFYGNLASYYYLSHETILLFKSEMKWNSSVMQLIDILCMAKEYANFPVRHNEDNINKEMVNVIKYDVRNRYDEAHVKVAILIHLHLCNQKFPNQEYAMDFKSVMDQAIRILMAMVDIGVHSNWFSCALRVIHIIQMIVQGQYINNPILLTLPGVNSQNLRNLQRELLKYPDLLDNNVPNLMSLAMGYIKSKSLVERVLKTACGIPLAKLTSKFLSHLPILDITIRIPQLNLAYSKTDHKAILLKPDHEYDLLIRVKRLTSKPLFVQAHKFPKNKEEGWFVFLGNALQDTIVTSKRITIENHYTFKLGFHTPPNGAYVLTLMFVSDSYLGLDQQYDLNIFVSKNA